jgi:hypothetical protein
MTRFCEEWTSSSPRTVTVVTQDRVFADFLLGFSLKRHDFQRSERGVNTLLTLKWPPDETNRATSRFQATECIGKQKRSFPDEGRSASVDLQRINLAPERGARHECWILDDWGSGRRLDHRGTLGAQSCSGGPLCATRRKHLHGCCRYPDECAVAAAPRRSHGPATPASSQPLSGTFHGRANPRAGRGPALPSMRRERESRFSFRGIDRLLVPSFWRRAGSASHFSRNDAFRNETSQSGAIRRRRPAGSLSDPRDSSGRAASR